MYEYGFPSFKNSGTKVCACFDGRQNFQSQFQCNCLRDIPLKLRVEFRSGVSMVTPGQRGGCAQGVKLCNTPRCVNQESDGLLVTPEKFSEGK